MTPQHVEVVAVAEDVPLRHPPSVSVEQGSDFLARPDVVADARGHRGSSGIRVRVSLLVPPLARVSAGISPARTQRPRKIGIIFSRWAAGSYPRKASAIAVSLSVAGSTMVKTGRYAARTTSARTPGYSSVLARRSCSKPSSRLPPSSTRPRKRSACMVRAPCSRERQPVPAPRLLVVRGGLCRESVQLRRAPPWRARMERRSARPCRCSQWYKSGQVSRT